MSPSAYITTRITPKGDRRYVVRYRLGGRETPLVHAGSFATKRDAQARVDLVRGELATGRNPALLLAALANPTASTAARTLRAEAERYKTSRIDIADETRKNLDSHLRRILDQLGDRDPGTITVSDVRTVVGKMAAELSPASVSRYTATLRLLLDFCEVTPNPARDERVKLPSIVREEPSPPDADHLLAILDKVPPRWVLPFIVAEQTGMRVGELASLSWGDVDEDAAKFRLRATETKGRRSRWVQLPEWLMAEVSSTCPREDRTPTRHVFPGFTADAAKNAMARACKTAGIPHFHPHDLRHRRLTLWHHQGVPARVMADRAGHARASMSLDVYSHVMPLSEVPESRLRKALVRSR